jgi:3(or 17)beta-hydroxysteroid dehydrogenase
MADRLSGKVIVITGGASGMGAATVSRCVEEGAHVFSTDIQAELGIEEARRAGAAFLLHDVADGESWTSVIATVLEQHGRLDALMNNAGIVTKMSIEDVDHETWNRVLSVNLTGVMLGCQQAIAAMRKGGGGSIINVASTTAFAAHPYDVGYTAAKSAVRMLTKAVAFYCGRKGYNIRCNAICPGAILTGLSRKSFAEKPELQKVYAAMSPLNRMGQGSDIAAMAVFLASDESTFMTGSDYMVDGGMLSGHPGF